MSGAGSRDTASATLFRRCAVLGMVCNWRMFRTIEWKQFLKSFASVFGVLWLVIEPLGFSFPSFLPRGWALYGALVVCSGIVGIWWIWPRMTVSAKLSSPDTIVQIKVGDLFEQPGHLVVGTNDCFDTELGDVISTRSVQGQFEHRVYDGDLARLDEDIRDSLKPFDHARTEDGGKTRGKRWRYPIGTIAALGSGSSRYFLVAYATMGNDLTCTSSVDSLWSSLRCLWKDVREKGECAEVSIPIVGSELARTGLPRNSLIQLILLSFVLASKESVVSKKLNIVVWPTDLEHVDIASLPELLKNACF